MQTPRARPRSSEGAEGACLDVQAPLLQTEVMHLAVPVCKSRGRGGRRGLGGKVVGYQGQAG